jgi:hypothetical protein
VVTIAGHHWPAWKTDEGLIVDLRICAATSVLSETPVAERYFDPAHLRSVGVPEELITAAEKCEPLKGFVLMEGSHAAGPREV